MKTEFLGKTISGPFTIPSGIVTCAVPIIERFFDAVPQVGVLTTKSIGPQPRLGYREPILAQYAPGCFVNAVGLTNPGADQSAELLASLRVPDDKFLLISIFGASLEEYVEVAKKLAPYGDGLELNLSCPHARGYGMDMGQDPRLVREITEAVKASVDIPVIPKLTPNVGNFGEIAEAAAAGGADALCAINTVGPGLYDHEGQPVLSNGEGGISGKGILPLTLKCVREISARVDCPIIACGGLSSAADARSAQRAGAAIIGIGSALVGMSTEQIAAYFRALERDLAEQEDRAESLVQYDVDMDFSPLALVENRRICHDIAILTFDRKVDLRAGEFVFLWIPGLGEKPFSALVDDPFTLVVVNLGSFTEALINLEPGAEAYVRGPYGIAVNPPSDARIIAVSGGTGLAAVHQIARDFGNAEIFFGARTRERLYFTAECEAVGALHIATDDGSQGFHGLVTELLREKLSAMAAAELENLRFYNCGPPAMVRAAQEVERQFCGDHQIWNAIDYLTKCGVGLCGACNDPEGRRSCVDGPFLGAG